MLHLVRHAPNIDMHAPFQPFSLMDIIIINITHQRDLF